MCGTETDHIQRKMQCLKITTSTIEIRNSLESGDYTFRNSYTLMKTYGQEKYSGSLVA
jgi:hypothetical protein